MIIAIARASSALAVWRAAEAQELADCDDELLSVPEIKSVIAQAHEEFMQSCYDIAFDLAPKLHAYGEVTTKHGVRYSAVLRAGGHTVQKMDLDPENPGVMLMPGRTRTNNWLQLMIDLPELLKVLNIR